MPNSPKVLRFYRVHYAYVYVTGNYPFGENPPKIKNLYKFVSFRVSSHNSRSNWACLVNQLLVSLNINRFVQPRFTLVWKYFSIKSHRTVFVPCFSYTTALKFWSWKAISKKSYLSYLEPLFAQLWSCIIVTRLAKKTRKLVENELSRRGTDCTVQWVLQIRQL